MYLGQDLTFKPIYNGITANFFNTSLEKVNFESPKDTAELINNYVKERTNGAIYDVFEEGSIDPMSK